MKPSKAPAPPIDDTVSVPKAVREAAARSEQLLAEANAQTTDTTTDTTTDATTTDTTAEPTPTPPSTPAPTPAPSPAVTQPGNDQPPVNWEHKFRSLEGRYNAQSGRLADLENLIATMQAAPTPAPATPAPRARLITPEEEAEYGSEFLSVVAKRAREEFLPEVEGLKQTVERLTGSVQQAHTVAVKSARDKMLETLGDKVPNWQAINTNENFLAWLQLPDAFSGVTRQSLLTQAYERNETNRVLAFFEGFLASEAALDPQVTEPAPSPSQGKIPLETLAAPGRAKSAAPTEPGGPAEKPTFTRAEIAKFYADVNAGRYRGREADRSRIEKQIFDAGREGRIS